jgi:hypothetical protein
MRPTETAVSDIGVRRHGMRTQLSGSQLRLLEKQDKISKSVRAE